ncbi:MAG TPA: DUF4234 domain-containing protein [Streptomyces sp.]|uniref:DUF4234 domain-containing protein n=1 Tax=Streptomyces sp. TaxID=1931 RepID=UPI002B6F7B42|nr:DUF4234 domain-containing protein [Streptomyces sp.]HWU05800.1 DUF4234 domain-containing protein [Streptomyces sp.]
MADTQPTTTSSTGALSPAGDTLAPRVPGTLQLSGAAMKRRGPVAVWLGLTLITLGIYQLVWYYKIHNELQEFDRRQALKPAGSLLVLLFLGWTVIAPLISFRNTGRAIASAQRAAGLPVTCSPAASMWLMFVFGLNVWYMQRQLNLVVEAYPGATPGTAVSLAA